MKSNVTDHGELGVSAKIKEKAHGPSDHYIHRIEIEPAKNGHVVTIHRRLKPEVEAADRAKSIYGGSSIPEEKSVFPDGKKAGKFISKALAGDCGEPGVDDAK